MTMNTDRDYTGLRFSFAARYVPLLAPFVAVADLRYYLCGLRVESAGDRPGVYVIGCNGHQLMLAYDKDGTIHGDDGEGVTLQMPREFVSACKKRQPAILVDLLRVKGNRLQVVGSGKRVSVCPGFGHMGGLLELFVLPGFPYIDGGKFPNWRAVLPTDWRKLKPGFVNEVSADYLADFAKLDQRGNYRENGVRFWQEEPDRPIIVQHMAHAELVSVLMPRRDQVDGPKLIERMDAIIERRHVVTEGAAA